MRFYSLVCTLLITLLLTSCATSTRKKMPLNATAVEISTYQQAKTLIQQGKVKEGFKLLNMLTSSPKQNDVTDDAYYLKAEYFYSKKNYVEAYRNYLPIIKSEYYSPKEADAYLKSSKCLYKNGQPDEALSLINTGLKTAQMNRATKLQAFELKRMIETNSGDYVQAINSLSYIANQNNNIEQKQTAIKKAKDIIESKIKPEYLNQITKNEIQNTEISALTHLKIANYFKQTGNTRAADTYYRKVIQISPVSTYAEIAKQSITNKEVTTNYQPQSADVSPNTIGVILPLTGKHKHIGQKTLKGIQLALGVFGGAQTDFKLAIFDSKSNVETASQGVDKLVNQDNVIAIIGGLLGKTSQVISKKCNAYRVPNISLSQKSNLTQIGDYIFRNALTGKSLVKTLVKTAMEKRGIKKFAILYPNDKYGTEYANLFWDEVRARGGEITSAQNYPPNETDFKTSVKKLVGTYYIEDRKDEYQKLLNRWYSKNKGKRKSSPDDLLPPVVDFDGLFIPDSTKALGQIAPMLNYYDVHDITLLGTNIWNQKDLIRRGQLFVEGALFVEDKSMFEKTFTQTSFYKQFNETFSESPNSFSAQAYDSAKLVAMIIENGSRDRDSLREELAELKSFTGARGNVFINRQREMISPLVGLTIRDKKVIAVE